jgi:ADP-ribose pyrophosphatase YjhB (NUDIX family)
MENAHKPQYRNPHPVVLLLLPVDDGVLLIRRKGTKRHGQLAFPGGYLEVGETWQEGAARELFEESGIRISADTVSLLSLESSEDGELLLIFAVAEAISGKNLPQFLPNLETSERVVVFQPVELAFPLHSEVLRRYFAQVPAASGAGLRAAWQF